MNLNLQRNFFVLSNVFFIVRIAAFSVNQSLRNFGIKFLAFSSIRGKSFMKNHRAKTKGPKFGLLNSFLTTVKFWMISPGLRISDCYIAFMQPCNDWMISASQILGSEFRTLGWFLYNTAAKTQGQRFGLLHGFRFIQHYRFGRNMSKTSASVSSEVPNTEKQMKARGRRPSAFIERFHMTSQISREI